MHPRNLQIADFNYDLAEASIAKYPLAERDSSRLLLFDNTTTAETTYRNLAEHLPTKSLLVFNNTRVVEARILFQKPTGGVIEIFCLEPHESADVTTGMMHSGSVRWRCLVGGASKWKHGQVLSKKITVGEREVELQATIADRLPDCFVINLSWGDDQISFAEILHAAGLIPLPPYLNRPADDNDKVSYQTVYAQNDGSVAAPTAGLHFTPHIFESLEAKSISTEFVTLHVGAGTFKPVKTSNVGGHEMHAEFFEVSIPTLEALIENLQNPVVAVGTTSLRTLESLYWLGVKVCSDQVTNSEILSLEQWFPYDNDSTIPAEHALKSLVEWIKAEGKNKVIATTQIMIAPGYKFRIVKGIVTNFHQPQSTLLLLIAAMVGDDWKRIYQYAIENNFRFLSYGDGSLLWVKRNATA